MRDPLHLAAGLVVALAVLLPAVAGAAVFEVEPFDYPGNTGSGLDGLNGGTGWGGNAWSDTDALPTVAATNTSLSYPANVPLAPAGGRIEVTADSANNPAARLLGTPMSLATDGQTYYSSALFRRSAATGELASVLFDRTSDSAIRWYYGIDTNGFFSTAVNPSDAGQRATSTTPALADTTYLLVSRIRTNTGPGGNDEVFLEIFPEGSPVTEPAADDEWDLRENGNSGITIERVRLAFSNAAGQTNQFDELRVGTTFADVTGVPEPGATSLLALPALLLARRRRR